MIVFLSLGSNIGNRYENLNKAISLINFKDNISIILKSKIYETSPMEYLKQDFFLNQVISIDTDIAPLDLLKIVKEIEVKIGRERQKNKYMPRVIDIDILSYNDLILNNKNLFIPHPKIKFRKFILKPWTDISPDYILPNSKSSIKQLLERVSHLRDKVREYN